MSGPPPGGGPGFGAPPGAMMQAPGGAPMMGGGGGGAMMGGGPPGTIRNPVMVLLISYFCCFYYGLFQCMKAEEELNKFTGKNQGGSILWLLFPLIPALSMPKLIGEARQKAGGPTQGDGSLIMYILIAPYALIKDANDIWQAMGVKPS